MKQITVSLASLILALATGSAAHAQYPAGLAAYWQFNEASGSTAVDSVGTNTGTINGIVSRIAGAVGQGNALQFNNVGGQGVNVGSALSALTGVTIEALIRPTWSAITSDYDHIFRKADGNNLMLVAFQQDGNRFGTAFPAPVGAQGPVLSFGLNIGGTYQELDMPLDGMLGRPTLASLTDGGWHQVVASYDSLTGVKQIAVDGSVRFSAAYTPGRLIFSGGAAPAFIGSDAGGAPFTGGIDEVAFYGRAITAGEIQSHNDNKNAGRPLLAVTTVPEPSSIALLALPVLGIIARRRIFLKES